MAEYTITINMRAQVGNYPISFCMFFTWEKLSCIGSSTTYTVWNTNLVSFNGIFSVLFELLYGQVEVGNRFAASHVVQVGYCVCFIVWTG